MQKNLPFTNRSLCILRGKINRDHADDDVKKSDGCVCRDWS